MLVIDVAMDSNESATQGFGRDENSKMFGNRLYGSYWGRLDGSR
ncbi:MAG: hypothetical protein ACR2N1_09670 [Rubripirellula sp.]